MCSMLDFSQLVESPSTNLINSCPSRVHFRSVHKVIKNDRRINENDFDFDGARGILIADCDRDV